MSVTDQIPDPLVSVTTADALGIELARAVMTQAEATGESVIAFAGALSLDTDRLHAELIYLSILTTQFALSVALGAGESTARVRAAFQRALWAGAPWQIGRAHV